MMVVEAANIGDVQKTNEDLCLLDSAQETMMLTIGKNLFRIQQKPPFAKNTVGSSR